MADAATLQKHLHAKQVMFELNHGKKMSCPAMAQARAAPARVPPPYARAAAEQHAVL